MSRMPQLVQALPAVEDRATGDAAAASPAADNPSLDARLARLERAITEQRQASDAQLAALAEALAELRRLLGLGVPPTVAAAPGDTASELALRRRLAEVEAVAQQQITALSQALSKIQRSLSWRVTAPLRKLVAALPEPRRAALRRLARRIFWLLTPHRMKMRRQWVVYAPQNEQTVQRLAALSTATRERLRPLRRSYGPTAIEQVDIYPAASSKAPLFVFIHGGGWRAAEARHAAFAADTFVAAGAAYLVLDFIGSQAAAGDFGVIVEQVCRGVAWVYRNATSFGGDPDRLYLGGHSSGGHLCAMALVNDWQSGFGLPEDLVKGALLMSGIYDLHSIRLAKYAPQMAITDEIEQVMSPLRQIDRLNAPVIITVGGDEAPEFRQQSHDLFAAATAAGKTAELIEAAHFGHLEMAESLGSPYGPNGRAALRLMRLAPP